MVLSIILATAMAPGLLGSQEAIRQSQSKEKREEHRARRCNLIATCVKSSKRSRELNGRAVVLKNGKLCIDTGTEDGFALGHTFAGYYLPYPDAAYEGLVTTITEEAPVMNWVYVERATHQVRYGVRADAQANLTGPFDCTRQDRRLTFDGWEGWCAVEQSPGFWALYFDVDDDGLKSKVAPGMKVLELELTRKEKRFQKEKEARQQDQTTKREVDIKQDAPVDQPLAAEALASKPGVVDTRRCEEGESGEQEAYKPLKIPKSIFEDPPPLVEPLTFAPRMPKTPPPAYSPTAEETSSGKDGQSDVNIPQPAASIEPTEEKLPMCDQTVVSTESPSDGQPKHNEHAKLKDSIKPVESEEMSMSGLRVSSEESSRDASTKIRTDGPLKAEDITLTASAEPSDSPKLPMGIQTTPPVGAPEHNESKLDDPPPATSTTPPKSTTSAATPPKFVSFDPAIDDKFKVGEESTEHPESTQLTRDGIVFTESPGDGPSKVGDVPSFASSELPEGEKLQPRDNRALMTDSPKRSDIPARAQAQKYEALAAEAGVTQDERAEDAPRSSTGEDSNERKLSGQFHDSVDFGTFSFPKSDLQVQAPSTSLVDTQAEESSTKNNEVAETSEYPEPINDPTVSSQTPVGTGTPGQAHGPSTTQLPSRSTTKPTHPDAPRTPKSRQTPLPQRRRSSPEQSAPPTGSSVRSPGKPAAKPSTSQPTRTSLARTMASGTRFKGMVNRLTERREETKPARGPSSSTQSSGAGRGTPERKTTSALSNHATASVGSGGNSRASFLRKSTDDDAKSRWK